MTEPSNGNPPAIRADLPATLDPESRGFMLPAVIAAEGPEASERFFTFFTDTIRNVNTRAAYYRNARRFFRWLHPGGVASNVWRALPQPVQWFIKLFLISNEEGARTPLYCATDPALATTTGRYYDKCREAPCNPLANDAALARELWVRTEAAIG